MATLNQRVAGIAWDKPADLSSKEVLKRLSPAGVKAFLKIAELWELRDEDARQLLGGMSAAIMRKARVTHGIPIQEGSGTFTLTWATPTPKT